MTGPALRLEGVTVTRGSGRAARDVLVGVDLEVAASEVVGVSGRSGSGKSSLLALLSGDLTPTAGRITVAKGTVAGPPTRIRRARPGTIAIVAQDPASTLDPLWTIGRIVAEPLRAAGVARADAARRAREALTAVSLGHLDPRRRPRQLSVGQAQRVAIARALAGRPALLLADEPTSALDVTTAAGVAGLLRAAADTGAAVVVASHDHRLLDALSDRRLAIDGSRLVSVPHRLGLANGTHA